MSEHNERDTPYWNSELDQQIGSILEGWQNRDTGEYCRFCADEHVGDVPPAERFCSDECEASFDEVAQARIVIGERDLEKRGYD